MNEAILRIEHLSKSFGKREILRDIDFSVHPGDVTSIIGASGSGKSTLLNVIATIDRPSAGKILLEGENLAEKREQELSAFRRDRLGFVFQEYNLLDTLTVEENIVLPLNLQKCPFRETEARLKEVAQKLELTGQLSKFPRELSGGQRQRAACARALITKPALILADEPTGGSRQCECKGADAGLFTDERRAWLYDPDGDA